jgi:hypothetical protein
MMTTSDSYQHNLQYAQAAARTGIHSPLLAALQAAHQHPPLRDEALGLGVSPANQITVEAVETFAGQVEYAANTVRSLTNQLTAKGWKPEDFWDVAQGRYRDSFVRTVADGYAPPSTDTAAARLESANPQALLDAYQTAVAADYATESLDSSFLSQLDERLLTFTTQVPRAYSGLSYQRHALLELVRLWRKLDTSPQAIESLELELPEGSTLDSFDPTLMEQPLLIFAQQVPQSYSRYPHQREALIRMAQLWGQHPTRTRAIAHLDRMPLTQTGLAILDPVLMARVQTMSQQYRGRGRQRLALTDLFQTWQQLPSRDAALVELGVDPQALSPDVADDATVANAAAQMDRTLLHFLRQLPQQYEATDQQRDALLRGVQRWHGFDQRDTTIQSLFADLRQMEQAHRTSPDATPAPRAMSLPTRPSQWTTDTLHPMLPILPQGSFIWSEATQGGRYLPTRQFTIDQIVQGAQLFQQARDRINRPFYITRWYVPLPDAEKPLADRGISVLQQRHGLGDAIEFYVPGLNANQIYWALAPWWPGGLGRFHQHPYLVYLDAGEHRVRWII